ncbi:hypothetical protein KR51_00036410 [Rubidibacter lacunae KORDI 51-2]|uniref:Uncharacterized protein n=1 Tax=Rubidibacter lacunae KORDI 51-2 TaxID=582515 RepID=U5DH25_9CHRO|nr:hypothetical protein [Rubidibacter lacunae]ERN39859.1 hypothetical protein KR51_00036410 [Rubidibacter lacunae KORDI 51-2]
MSETKIQENGSENATTAPQSEQGGALSLQPKQAVVRSIGNRPVEASNLAIAGTFRSLGGERPIFANGMQTVGSFTDAGIRPIAASPLKVAENYSNFGNRPVASNEIDDPGSLMGFLD